MKLYLKKQRSNLWLEGGCCSIWGEGSQKWIEHACIIMQLDREIKRAESKEWDDLQGLQKRKKIWTTGLMFSAFYIILARVNSKLNIFTLPYCQIKGFCFKLFGLLIFCASSFLVYNKALTFFLELLSEGPAASISSQVSRICDSVGFSWWMTG